MTRGKNVRYFRGRSRSLDSAAEHFRQARPFTRGIARQKRFSGPRNKLLPIVGSVSVRLTVPRLSDASLCGAYALLNVPRQMHGYCSLCSFRRSSCFFFS